MTRLHSSPPTRRGPYRNGIERRKQIIESAAKIFGRYGYAGGSLRQIAEEVGVSPAALMRHFSGKEELLLAVLDYWDQETDKLLPESVEGLARFLHLPESVAQHTEAPGLVELFLTISGEATNPAHPAHEFIAKRYERVISTAVVDLQKARDRHEVAFLTDAQILAEVSRVYALMDGIQLQWLLDRSIDVVGTFTVSLNEIIARWKGLNTIG